MCMLTTFEYMQLATRVYASSDKNAIGVPVGWVELNWEPDKWDGFSVGAYMKGNDIVISYTGTNGLQDAVNWSIGLGNIRGQRETSGVRDALFSAPAEISRS